MQRIYEEVIAHHFANDRQMIFLAGPRQVGKTTIALWAEKLGKNFHYVNWDNIEYQHMIIRGPRYVFENLGLNKLSPGTSLVVFDEIHKFSRWKQFLKGFFDSYGQHLKIIVTGSSRLDIYKKLGDSLMGRYFLYRVHPLSIAELLTPTIIQNEIRSPKKISEKKFADLLEFGGFPEPFLKADRKFHQRWQRLRHQQTFHEDIRNLTDIQEIAQIEMLASFLQSQTGQLVSYSSLGKAINVSTPTVKRWIESLSAFYYCFTIQPWYKNVSRSLVKQPKIYLWDWSSIKDEGARAENFVAAHLLKAVNFWNDYGFGEFGLYFLRDKEKREVDFAVTRNKKVWFLVEVKNSQNGGISKSLSQFQAQTQAEHAFQVVFDMIPVEKNCFDYRTPIIVPVQTLLSQLI